ENVMGTSLELRVRASDEKAARWAEERVLAEIDRLSAIFSTYQSDSEFSVWQLTSNLPVSVSAELLELLHKCDHWRAVSYGAFDPRIEVISRLWSKCATQSRMPERRELEDALTLLLKPPWALDLDSKTATRQSACPLTLNAIAKGHIVEQAAKAAFDKSRGTDGILLNVGGDLCVRGDVEQTVGIAPARCDSESTE